MEAPSAPRHKLAAKADAAAAPVPANPQTSKPNCNGTRGCAQARRQQAARSSGERSRATAAMPRSCRRAARNSPSFWRMHVMIQEYSTLLKRPSGSTLWRAGKGGIIERSTDAGKTWVPQTSPTQEDWLAGAAVSDTVCWVGGAQWRDCANRGRRAWERIAPPRRPPELMPENCRIGPASRRRDAPIRDDYGERRAPVRHGGRRENLAGAIAKYPARNSGSPVLSGEG